jgi:ubiquitin C-terminal hydrolase
MAAARKFRNQPDSYHVFFYIPRAGNSYPGPEALYDYELFAVINHEGQIDNGHYTSFARFQDTVRHSIPSHLISCPRLTD